MSKVLVVEDQRDLASLLAHNLRLEGLDVRTVEDGREVLGLVHSFEQLEQAEWLRDVLIRVQPKAANLVVLLASRREDEHRQIW